MAIQYICVEPTQNGDSYSCKSLIALDSSDFLNGLAITHNDSLIIGGWLLTCLIACLVYLVIVKAIKIA